MGAAFEVGNFAFDEAARIVDANPRQFDWLVIRCVPDDDFEIDSLGRIRFRRNGSGKNEGDTNNYDEEKKYQ